MKAKSGGVYGATNDGMDSGWTVYPENDGDEDLPVLDDWLAPDDVEQIGDVGGDSDDTDGIEMPKTRWFPLNPREFFLLSRMDEGIKQFKTAIAKRRSGLTGEERVPDEEWRRLGDEALGLVQKRPVASKPNGNEHDSNASGTVGFNRDIAVLKEAVVLETRVAYEIGMAKHHMERAIEGARAITRLRIKSDQEQLISDDEWLASARTAFGRVNDKEQGAGNGYAGSPMGSTGYRFESRGSDAPETTSRNAWWAAKTAETADFELLSRLLAKRAASALALIHGEAAPRKS